MCLSRWSEPACYYWDCGTVSIMLSPPHIILTCLFDTFRSEQLYKEPGLEIKSFSRWKCVPRDFRVENVTTVSLCFLLKKKSHTQNNLYIFFATIISCFFFVAATLLVYNRSWFVLTKMYSRPFCINMWNVEV